MRCVHFIYVFVILGGLTLAAQSNFATLINQAAPSKVSNSENPDRSAEAKLPVPFAGPPLWKKSRGVAASPFVFSSRRDQKRGYQSAIHRNFKKLTTNASAFFLEAPAYSSGGDDADSTVVADVNGDGKLDLVVANNCATSTSCTNGVVGVLLGNGDGTFQAAVSYGSGGYEAYSIAVADVNGDGKLDVVVANDCASSSNCTNGMVGVLLGNGDGTFQPAKSYSSGGGGARSIAVADVNGDGKPDLLVANFSGSVGVLLGNGDGTFQAAVTYSSGGDGTRSVAVGDVNRDGKPDIVLASRCENCSGGVGVLLGNGDGTFQAVVSYGSGGYEPTSIAVGDVNGDGKPDLLVANYCAENDEGDNCPNAGSVGVLLGNGDGTFQLAVSYSSGGYNPDFIAVGDVNGDGKPDLLVANQCAGVPCSALGEVDVLLGNGDGTFRAAVGYSSGGDGASSIAVGDVNGDGEPDLLVANTCASNYNCTAGTLGVLLGRGDGTFQSAPTYGSGGYDADAIAVGDVNRDGKPDLLVLNYCSSLIPNDDCADDGSLVGVLLGNGDGTFQPAITYGSGGEYGYAIAVADVNRDGKPDLLVANLCSSKFCLDGQNGVVGVLLGNGDGTFQAAVSYNSGGDSATSIAVADVNGDGKPDLLVSNLDSSSVAVLLGNGDGTFQTAVSYGSGGYNPTSIAVEDVNGDGKPDIVAANECASSSNCTNGVAGVLLGNGDGTFQTAVPHSSGGYNADSIALGDVNGDGKPDIVVANECASSSNCTNGVVGVLLGNGDGTFQPAIITTALGLISSTDVVTDQLALADFDGDGKLDVASGAGDFLLLGNGDGTFQSPLLLGSGSGSGIALGDFNRDGKPDLVAGGGVNVLLNITQRLSPTTTNIASSLNPSAFGQSVTFTATVRPKVSGTPTGTVTFYNGTTNIGSSNLNNIGVATLTTSNLSVGTHGMTATYNGDANFATSTSPVLNQVVQGAIALLSPTSLNFGNQIVGTTSSPQNVTLQNGGNINLTITSLQITGTNRGDFGEKNNCPSSLAPNNSCQISVTFKPTTTGTRNAAVSITDNAPNSPQSVSLTGVGVLPAVTLSPTNLTFPIQLVFTASKPQLVTLTNTGTGVLKIKDISVAGPFQQTNHCPASLNPNAHCTISVTFHPTAKGVQNGAMNVTDNAPGSPQKVPLKGTGTFVQLLPAKLDFGTQPVGTSSPAKKITLTNKGDSVVKITGIAITGTDAGDFAETNTCGKSVAAGASCFIEVTFKPLVKGKRTADVSIYDNGGGSPQKVALMGTGI